jgi:hypothetical protein
MTGPRPLLPAAGTGVLPAVRAALTGSSRGWFLLAAALVVHLADWRLRWQRGPWKAR